MQKPAPSHSSHTAIINSKRLYFADAIFVYLRVLLG